MRKYDEEKIMLLQAAYHQRFGEFFPSIGIAPTEIEESIERCLRLNKTQDQIMALRGRPKKATV
jgi:hypothetical protein